MRRRTDPHQGVGFLTMLGFEGGSPYKIVGRGLDLPTQNSEEPFYLYRHNAAIVRVGLAIRWIVTSSILILEKTYSANNEVLILYDEFIICY